jgi:hypothetical protein
MIASTACIRELILASTLKVTKYSRYVRLDSARIQSLARSMAPDLDRPPAWDRDRHFDDRTARTAQWVFILDCLNFCFWANRDDEVWRVPWRGQMVQGYWSLACSLRHAMEQGIPLTEAAFLENMDVSILCNILKGDGRIPLMNERVAVLRETGRVLRENFGGSFANLLEEGGGSAQATVRLVATHFPSFYDIANYESETVYFLKRAQILVSHIWGAFGGAGLGYFRDIFSLTAFADYRLPQVLRAFGILEYLPTLAERVDSFTELPAGSPEEVEIRAATISAVEKLRGAVGEEGRSVSALAIDWWLWDKSHFPDFARQPHHRTRTIFY